MLPKPSLSASTTENLSSISRSGLRKSTEKHVSMHDSEIEWNNLIFLPFHPVFKLLVLVSVFIKAMMGPIQSVYPIVYCNDVMDYHPFLIFIKYCYSFFCDSLYGIDTFLHIVHRQVVDKAKRREHLPKSALLVVCDLVSLVPFFRLVTSDPCPPARLWPNILAFNEFLVIYRVMEYFSLDSTHSLLKLLIGYTIVLGICVNCVSCFWLLLTYQGFCDNCLNNDTYYDWRGYVKLKHNTTDEKYTTFVYGAVLVYSFAVNRSFDESIPSAVLEYIMICIFMVAGYTLGHFAVLPKVFAESMLRLRRVCNKYSALTKIIEETKRRNPSNNYDKQVESHYILLWRKRSCVIAIPEFYSELPRYLKIVIKLDLLWPLFYHSPILRKTTKPFRRWLAESTTITYKLPGDHLYTAKHSHETLYYLNTGIMQLISVDDGVTPILSVTAGTIFGDINFLVPKTKKSVLVRCLTYCELYYVERKYMLRALHKYPKDREVVMKNAKERIEHAKDLFYNKKRIRGFDRNEDEGITWIKTRWWEISHLIKHYTLHKSDVQVDILKTDVTREHTKYHCAKYLGQLVLCTKTELQTKSMFTKFKFPWILNPHSTFGYVWHKIVTITVILVMCLHPPNLIKSEIPAWFAFFSFCSDTIYILDIGVSLFTAVRTHDTVTSTFATVMFERFKSFTFFLDILSTVWIEDLADICGASPHYYNTLQFNRLIKVYILYCGDYLEWDIRQDPILNVSLKTALLYFSLTFISSHVVFEMIYYVPNITMAYFFGNKMCSKADNEDCLPLEPIVGCAVAWAFEWTYSKSMSKHLIDIYVAVLYSFISYMIYMYCKGRLISYLYFKNRDIVKYQCFVANINVFYQHHRIHQDLLKRLHRYLICHWKYYKGTDVLYPNSLENEPYTVYWKAQGKVAHKVIKESKAFRYADPALIKDLAYAGKFLVQPRSSRIIMFGAQCKNVIWVVQGFVKSECHDETGNLLTSYFGPGCMLSVSAVLLGRARSLRAYTTCTECEVMYIPIKEFIEIYKKYPAEYSFWETCVEEFESLFDDMLRKYLLKRRDYQLKHKDVIYSTGPSKDLHLNVIPNIQDTRSLPVEGYFWGQPSSGFMQFWLSFRAIIVCISIMSASMLGGIGAVSRWGFMMITAFCDCVAWIDIVLKLCLPFYDDRGLLISDKRKCLINYLTKGFVLDIIGAAPWLSVLTALLSHDVDEDTTFLINTFCKFAHLYIVFAYFDFIMDSPTANVASIMVIKWQIINILIIMGSSHYLMANCVNLKFNDDKELVNISLRNHCWMPTLFKLPVKLDRDQLHLIFAESLNLAESSMMKMNFGRFVITREHIRVGFVLFTLGSIFWSITCYTLTLLVLRGQRETQSQHCVNQLQRFLTSERVEKNVINKVIRHFRYSWFRTKGVNSEHLTKERISSVLREELSYFFYKQTFTVLDKILGGGETMQRRLASASEVGYFLPGHDIFREMDLVSTVCIVHRGNVKISKNGKMVIILTKGDILGPLDATKQRPARVTATADDHVDLLYIEIPIFQSIITDEVKETIANSDQAKNDYMATEHVFIENPYDTVQYLLRRRKTIMFPWSKAPVEAIRGTWYSRWLYLAWLIGPFISSSFVLLFFIVPKYSDMWTKIYLVLFVMDAIHSANFIADFYAIEFIVEKKMCVYKGFGVKNFKYWGFYVDALSLFVPLLTLFTNDWRYQLARLLRLKLFIDFEFNFCRSLKNYRTVTILKLVIMLLLMHLFTCGWIVIACRDEKFPIPVPPTRHLNKTIDPSEWVAPNERVGGCARITGIIDENYKGNPAFVVPRYWAHDYVIAMTYILLIHTRTDLDIVVALSLKQVYYKVIVTFFMYLLDIWIMAVAINFAYFQYRELYRYDFRVNNMITFLTDIGISKSVKHTFIEYTQQVWKRQKGDWLPELAYEGPPCLRQDLFSALYMHHLESAPTFRQLPLFFKRQLAARLRRVVILPGKCIVREGDKFNTTYFIHEGEVEKWYTDSSGDMHITSVLHTNSYFGCVSGLFVDVGFQFSYYSRTVVDLVFLNLMQWEDLLEGYPDIKDLIYASTKRMRKFTVG